jgi:putative ABC transport system permease protein
VKIVRLSLLMLRRDWRTGELTVLALALVIAVGSTTSVGFFTDRIDRALHQQANELLGGDAVVIADHPLPDGFMQAARTAGLRTARTRDFHSMVLAGDKTALADIKAVTPGYPLRGTLRLSSALFGPSRPVAGIPAPGAVWLDPRLFGELQLHIGDTVGVGNIELRVTAVIANEPDRAGNLFSLAPRLMMNMADVASTGLIIPGSRVRYRLLVAGTDAGVRAFRDETRPRLGRGERLEDTEDGRPEIRDALDRAEQFLGLAALVSVMIAGVAIATAARRFIDRHLDSCAVMRCLGASQGEILGIYGCQLLWVGLAASAAGCAVGYFAQRVLVFLLGDLTHTVLPSASLLPVLSGMGIGLIALGAFVLPPLLHLKRLPTLRVLRRDLGGLPPQTLAGYGAGLAALAALMAWQAGDIALAGYVLGGIAATLAVLSGMIQVLIRGLGRVRRRGSSVWRFGLGNITGRGRGTLVQVLALGLGVMVLLLLTFVRSDLITGWQSTLPDDAPNRFIINIQPDQVQAMQGFLADSPALAHPRFFPMVRGRLTAVNGREVLPKDYENERAQRLVAREFNLSWASRLEDDNKIVAGRWWGTTADGRHNLSVEQGLAQTLGIKLGDTLTFSVAGESFDATVTSLRKVDWDSFNVNFFVLLPPGVIEGYPTTYITSFYLPADQYQVLNDMVKTFPNITVLDVAAIMQEVRSIIARVSLAVEYVFTFTLVAGLMVLYAAIHATLDERIREHAVLRTLGARRRQLVRALWTEFAVLGALSGTVAAAAASVVGYVLAEHVFHFGFHLDPRLWLVGMGGGAVGIGAAGYAGTRFVLRQPPLQTLREI